MLPSLSADKWDISKAAHLLNRAGFGGSPAEIQAFHDLGFNGAVASLFDFKDETDLFPIPEFNQKPSPFAVDEPWLDVPLEPQTRLKIPRIQNGGQINDLRSWWLDRMLRTRNPLCEKMTLFWHGHFATSTQKVNDAFLMWQQNAVFRLHALGNFGDLAKAISRDPAMMIYLDTNRSNKAHPNENFAREVMELFTLGIGNYTEQDIQQGARAFTGYRINPADRCSFQFNAPDHDNGVKTFMGADANYDGDAILDKILEQESCSRFVARKLWRFLAYEEPGDALIEPLAASFRQNHYELLPLIRGIFMSAEFYSERARLTQIKSPVQWVVQTAKALEVKAQSAQMQSPLQQMGQVLFAPPNVKGWDGGKAWISTQTLLARYNLSQMFLNNNRPGEQVDLAKIAPPELRADPEKLVSSLAFRLFQNEVDPRELKNFEDYLDTQKKPFGDGTIRNLLHVMMSTPQFQLC